MATSFSQTLQALAADSVRGGRTGLAGVVIVLGIWLVWFLWATVGIYATAPAQLQAERAIHSVEAVTEGRVIAIHLAVGQKVHVGDILVELDDTPVRLRLAEHKAQFDSARAQLRTIKAEIAAQEHALAGMREAAPMQQTESQLRYQQAQPAALLADEELLRWRKLRENGFVTDLQMIEREAIARRRQSEAEELRLAISRQKLQHDAGQADRQANIERLHRDAAELAGLIAASSEVIQQTENAALNFVLRAPVDGPLADVAELRPGMIVHAGERLATIVPNGELKITADFPAADIGRIRPGQPAALRLDGFPAEQYGRLTATVLRVAQEPRIGKIRVELAMQAVQTAIPLQHGLPGSVEIEIERSSPALLLLRAAGALVRHADARGRQ